MHTLRLPLVLVVLLTAGFVAAAERGTASSTGAKLQVVAAENFWGSIASQLGGERVQVTSIVHSPSADPHDYEPTAADARTMAGAKLAIVNGIGYDPWAGKLIGASPSKGRIVLTIGDLVGIKTGGNPHRWYSPPNVQQVISAIVADYKQLDPAGAPYYERRRATFESTGLGAYKAEIALIKRRYGGVRVGASESIFAPLAQALGLNLITPGSFLTAISEGAEPTAADKTTIERQIAGKQIKVWVFNSQNSTPDVQRLTDKARKAGIPVSTITETLVPASASFQQWQVTQLRALASALGKATGK
jgi:zinc/manganese transport system substrate-binding protein